MTIHRYLSSMLILNSRYVRDDITKMELEVIKEGIKTGKRIEIKYDKEGINTVQELIDSVKTQMQVTDTDEEYALHFAGEGIYINRTNEYITKETELTVRYNKEESKYVIKERYD